MRVIILTKDYQKPSGKTLVKGTKIELTHEKGLEFIENGFGVWEGEEESKPKAKPKATPRPKRATARKRTSAKKKKK